MHPIVFGTSGHRGVVGEGFTPAHAIAICCGIKRYFDTHFVSTPSICLGYDARPGHSSDFEEGSLTGLVYHTLVHLGFEVTTFTSSVPTPFVSWAVVAHGFSGGINLTASHNPPEYDGIKFNPSNGAPSSGAVSADIQAFSNEFLENPILSESDISFSHHVNRVDWRADFVSAMLSQLQALGFEPTLAFTDLTVVIDSLHGTTGPIWQHLCTELKLDPNNAAHLHPDPRDDFGGLDPNPTHLPALAPLQTELKQRKASIGIANDPDGDRHVVIDETGTPVSAELICLIIFFYLESIDQDVAGIASTVASSSVLKAAAESHGRQYVETAVGFKHFQDFFQDCADANQIGLAVESSGGFSTSFHTWDKCGFLPCVMLLLILAETGQSLSDLVSDVHTRVGKRVFFETTFSFDPAKRDVLVHSLSTADISTLSSSFSAPILELIQVDGLKLVFESGDWILLRLSGTEPIGRLYIETTDSDTMARVKSEALGFIDTIRQ